MQVKNMTIYMGQDERVLRRQAENASKEDKSSKSISAVGLLNGRTDTILMRKQLAQKQAMKIVQDTFASEEKIDMDQDLRRENVKELKKQLNEIKENIAAQDFGDVPEEELTAEMKAQRDQAIEEYQRQASQLENQIEAQNMAIRDTKLERLKKSPMLKAEKEADAVLEAANDEILGMLIQEGKDHIDEEMEKKEEQQEKIEEKKEAEEAVIEKRQEREDELEELTEAVQDSGTDDVQKELEDMLEKLKLIEEDLKGVSVDTKL
ncbi:MAG: hypothetical protein NC417_08870 [Candidatus Gastranaerophilales bacterium]|nr:hypothetical protein [Candidatus Gastranaerophilales bacterium]